MFYDDIKRLCYIHLLLITDLHILRIRIIYHAANCNNILSSDANLEMNVILLMLLIILPKTDKILFILSVLFIFLEIQQYKQAAINKTGQANTHIEKFSVLQPS